RRDMSRPSNAELTHLRRLDLPGRVRLFPNWRYHPLSGRSERSTNPGGKVMYRKQRGITLMGFIMVATVAGFFALMGFKLFPAYSEYYGVVQAMKSVAGQPGADKMELSELQKGLQRRFDVGYVESVMGKQATLIRNEKGSNQLNMNYEYRKPLFYNLDYVAKFDYTVSLSQQAAP